MSKIKGKGIPTRQTTGAIGDIYIDTLTGKRYKCTNAYGVNGKFDYNWLILNSDPVAEEVKLEPKAVKKVDKVDKPETVEVEPSKEEPVVTETVEAEEAPVEEPKSKKRTNYSAAYDKKTK